MYTTLIKNNASEIQCLVGIIQCLVCIIFLFYRTSLFFPFDLSLSIRPPFPIFFVGEFYKNGEQVWRYRQLCFFVYWPESSWSGPPSPPYLCGFAEKKVKKQRFLCRIFKCSFFLVAYGLSLFGGRCAFSGDHIYSRTSPMHAAVYVRGTEHYYFLAPFLRKYSMPEVKNYTYKYIRDYDAYYIN